MRTEWVTKNIRKHVFEEKKQAQIRLLSQSLEKSRRPDVTSFTESYL